MRSSRRFFFFWVEDEPSQISLDRLGDIVRRVPDGKDAYIRATERESEQRRAKSKATKREGRERASVTVRDPRRYRKDEGENDEEEKG